MAMSTALRSSMDRRKVRVIYVGVVGSYLVCLALWWIYVGRSTLPMVHTTSKHYWLTLRDSNGLIHTAGTKAEATVNSVMTTVALSPPPLLPRKLKCLGWRQTGGCDANGPREPDHDLPCDRSVIGGSSGYCALMDEATDEEVHVMHLNCTSIHKTMAFKCEVAAQFDEFTNDVRVAVAQSEQQHHDGATQDRETQEQQQQQQVVATSDSDKNGIVMVMYPKLLVSVHASIRLLRSLGCTLPIELWYLESEMPGDAANVLEKHAILQSVVSSYGNVTLHGIASAQVKGFNSKVHAIVHSKLDNILFLDTDNVPVKDPTYLFSLPEFQETGAMFWPDFWHPQDTFFNVQHESLLWELLDMPFVDMFEQESGQILINKSHRKQRAALELLQLFAFHDPSLFEKLKLVHGDKDLFRLAWLRTNTSFHMIEHPPGAAGQFKANAFCGMTMVQFDPQGDVVFLHRNAMKFTRENAAKKQQRLWTHLQRFDLGPKGTTMTPKERKALIAEHYHILIFGGGNLFPGVTMCYGENHTRPKSGYFRVVEWQTLPFSEIETTLLEFVHDALALLK
ncbi:Vesicle transport protein, partial [Globisporangium splendens]